MDEPSMRVTRHADVVAILNDARFGVPAASAAGAAHGERGIAWLRANVARWSNDDDHDRRRALVESDLGRLNTEAGENGLRDDAALMTDRELDDAVAAGQIDVMSRLARRVPLTVLASRLGLSDVGRAVEAVMAVAAAYPPGCGGEAERTADPAVAELVGMVGPALPEEVVANRIGLLAQACEATAGLIGNAVPVVLDPAQRASTESILMEVLRRDPPVLATRRQRRPEGGVVVLDLAAANRDPDMFDDPGRFRPGRDHSAVLTFGAGLRPCPGSGQALALAAGVVEVIRRRCLPMPDAVSFEPSPNLRVAARLLVAVPATSRLPQ